MRQPPPWPQGRFPDGLSIQDAWVLSYTGWYRHFLSMQPCLDYAARRWAESMVDATLGVVWWVPLDHDSRRQQRLNEGFARLKERFSRELAHWSPVAEEHTRILEPASPESDSPAIDGDAASSMESALRPRACGHLHAVEAYPQNRPSPQPQAAQMDLFGF